ncbi:hypothetical protein, variant [Verruconis gallopava]|uniref:UEV domain-containing protein n=1 Tax=Verruconis gallopava TaxID=253628 RepID=A0A0D2A1N4_9PEZI|nr:hypothetical protein, variant [Verruconis gallopava]KIW00235.1 hypothetical protein, variant [Verruconis gallopava]
MIAYEHGTSALLLLLAGTIPVEFRGQVFHFPIHLWIPHAYPREAPIGFVVPNETMLVRPGQHVSGEGKIYHPYLAKWSGFWDKSSLLDLVAILREVFAKEPPVVSKQHTQQARPQQSVARTAPTPPPPLPPPPEEWRKSRQPTSHSSIDSTNYPRQHGEVPPPLPPKDVDPSRSLSINPTDERARQSSHGASMPPISLSRVRGDGYVPNKHWQDATYVPAQTSVDSRQGSRNDGPLPVRILPPHVRSQQQSHHELESPVSPSMSLSNVPPKPAQYAEQHIPADIQFRPPHAPYQPPQPLPQPIPQSHLQLSQKHPYQHPIEQDFPRRPPPQPQIDLLSSPLDVQLPGQSQPAEKLPVPPVPPNPEKDALLHALSQALCSQAGQIIANNNAAVQSLIAQHHALMNAQQTLQAEIESLTQLSSILDGNESALRQGLTQIDSSIANAATQRRPEIDTLIICPTVVGQQVYNAVAEEQAARYVRLALGKALDRGRIGVKEYVKEMRAIAREEFFRKVVLKKASAGMGLNMGEFHEHRRH